MLAEIIDPLINSRARNKLMQKASIIGAKTGKVLYVSSKSKYCPNCARALTKNIKPATHKCSKNWDVSSTSMESELILEGFLNIIKMHKLKYVKIIVQCLPKNLLRETLRKNNGS
ncbi:unnamed protein product [Psylliodes chrysocephalus]|uniref:Mutator-like transposase domain-containing protein n=1 Tax=Psylliodes chrysocephalus TaxID=3402493 RepID=A0A9P0CMS2_9CUCU|nr:unnamed protein product [Psylliodes chrysocephala]